MSDVDDALTEIKRRATHFDSTGYITIHEDELREALALLCDVIESARDLLPFLHATDSIPVRNLQHSLAALSSTPPQEPTE